jgi:hypothetical protein
MCMYPLRAVRTRPNMLDKGMQIVVAGGNCCVRARRRGAARVGGRVVWRIHRGRRGVRTSIRILRVHSCYASLHERDSNLQAMLRACFEAKRISMRAPCSRVWTAPSETRSWHARYVRA